jgi:contactin 2
VRTAGLDTIARVTGLHPNTKYHVTVRAYNRAGTGPASPPANATTTKPRESVYQGRGGGVRYGCRLCTKW